MAPLPVSFSIDMNGQNKGEDGYLRPSMYYINLALSLGKGQQKYA
jgi:hypothetical protein